MDYSRQQHVAKNPGTPQAPISSLAEASTVQQAARASALQPLQSAGGQWQSSLHRYHRVNAQPEQCTVRGHQTRHKSS